jgi:hypothetical protein
LANQFDALFKKYECALCAKRLASEHTE